MTQHLKVSRDEVIKVLEEHFKIKDILWMKKQGYEPDGKVCENFEYILGEKQ